MIGRFLLARFFGQDAIHVTGIGVDLTIVGYRDVLGAVLFLLYLKKLLRNLVSAASLDKVFSRLESQG